MTNNTQEENGSGLRHVDSRLRRRFVLEYEDP